jgi:DNA polymerase III subunit gamma/tau
MSDSQVIARKFRPQAFDQVVGQEAITRTLANALTTSRIHHAYLFTGARGVGKTTTARILAKCLNCAKGVTTEPCGVCASCLDIAASRSMDVMEIDAATHTQVENVREVIINSISIAPARDRYKIFIIDEVHMLSGHSFNALLKTIEEPPPRVVFIMATTEIQKIPETILSRCQVFEFRTITLKKIAGQLRHIAEQEKVTISDAALLGIARAGEGSMRDAESALDQVISFAGNNIKDEDVSAALGLVDVETLNETMRAIADQDSARILRIVDEVVSRGYDIRNFCREMMTHARGLLVIKVAGFDAELVQMAESEGERLTRLADAFSEQDLMRFFAILTKTEQDIRLSAQPRFQLEIGLIKLAHARRLLLIEDALRQLTELQSKLGVAPALVSSGTASAPPAASGSGKTAGPSPGPVRPRPAARSSEVADEAGRKAMPDPFARVSKPLPPVPPPPQKLAPVEPPPMDEPYEVEHDLPNVGRRSSASSSIDGPEAVAKIRDLLEAKNKMLIAMALANADVRIDGDFLRVMLSPGNARDKAQFEGKDKRQIVEETCREVVGRSLTLSVSVGGQVMEEAAPQKRAASQKKEPQEDPRVAALTKKFGGKVVEVKNADG